MTSEHHTSTLSSGSIIHNWSVSNPRAVVILQHGFGEYAERFVESYHRLIPRLNQSGYDIWALDMWGHGRSPGVRSIVNVEKAVLDHIELRKHVAEIKFDLPVCLLGHSLGGLVTAGSLCKDTTYPVNGVVLTGPALPVEMPLLARLFVNPVASMMPSLPASLGRVKTEGMCQPEEIEKFRNDPMTWKGHISFLLAATSLRMAEYIWPKLEDWTVPTMIMHGTKDTYTDYRQSQQFVESIRSGDKTMHLIDGGLHEALNDVGADDHFRTMLKWIDGHIEVKAISTAV